ncbi:MAG: Gfo/Idh/MocA family protein [Candidatus Geothermarchaeales archaeon]
MTINVGLVGCTSHGAHLASPLKELEALSFVYDQELAAAKRIGRKLHVPYGNSIEEAMKRRCDAVVIATPPRHHAGQIHTAVKKGKDILVTEPLASSLMETIKVMRLLKESDRILMVGAIQRFSQVNRKLRELVRNQLLRAPLRYGLLQDLDELPRGTPGDEAFHPMRYIDLTGFLIGEDPERVFASQSNEDEKEYSATNIVLDYPEGFKVFLTIGVVPNHSRQEILLVGESFSIHWKSTDGVIRLWREDKEREISIRDVSPIRTMLNEFLDSVRNREAGTSTLLDGVYAHLVWEMAGASMRAGSSLPIGYGVVEG